MTRAAKTWVGIALPVIIGLLLLIRHRIADVPARTDLHRKYHTTRMQIGQQLMKLRREFGTKQMHHAQNTTLEIRKLWNDRDMLYYVINGKKGAFQSDSLRKLERLIDRPAPLMNVLKEIERIEQINDTD
ncbi:hypothetical protein ACWKW6_27595 [Dyadobacter jiangsuensis]